MDISEIINTLGTSLGVIALYGGLLLGRTWLRQHQSIANETRLGTLVDILVTAAEQMNKRMGSGDEKLNWVIAQLKQRVSDFDEDLARVLIEAAVKRMNDRQAIQFAAEPPAASHRQWELG